MDIMGGLFILLCMAGFVAWQMPDALAKIEAALCARRRGIYFMRDQRAAHNLKIQGEN